jgi:hypothetical protein
MPQIPITSVDNEELLTIIIICPKWSSLNKNTSFGHDCLLRGSDRETAFLSVHAKNKRTLPTKAEETCISGAMTKESFNSTCGKLLNPTRKCAPSSAASTAFQRLFLN